jgi:hypothetical protein
MGTINERTSRDGKVTLWAQVRRKRGQQTLFSEAKTFARRWDAEGWIKRMEKAPDGAHPAPLAMRHATGATVIERYVGETHRKIGETKEQCLRAITAMEFGSLKAVAADQTAIIALMAVLRRTVQPQTVANYIARLSSICTITKPSHRIEGMQQAKVVGRAMG